MWTKEFWRDAAERAVKTFSQIILALAIGTGSLLDSPDKFLSLDWGMILSVSLIGAGLSVCMSVVSSYTNKKGSASLVE